MKTMTPLQVWELQCEIIAQHALGYLANAAQHAEANPNCIKTGCLLVADQLAKHEYQVEELIKLRAMGADEYYRATYGR